MYLERIIIQSVFFPQRTKSTFNFIPKKRATIPDCCDTEVNSWDGLNCRRKSCEFPNSSDPSSTKERKYLYRMQNYREKQRTQKKKGAEHKRNNQIINAHY
jgi:hypothetical protein